MRRLERRLFGLLGAAVALTSMICWRFLLKHSLWPHHHDPAAGTAINHFSSSHKEKAELQSQPKHGDVFAPGSLELGRLETYQRCFVDPTKYKHHFGRDGNNRCSISQKFRVAYHMIAKAGSSTCRLVMKKSLAGQERKCKMHEELDPSMFHFTFFREPTSRFFSSYQESFFRVRRQPEKIPLRYQRFIEPFVNLTRVEYQSLLRSNTTRDKQQLSQAFENFVNDYDAQEPFEGHIRLQIPRLTNRHTGRTILLNATYDSNKMEESFQEIRRKLGMTDTIEVIHAYDRGTSRMDFSGIDEGTRRKICELSAIDYCCLNYELPPECDNAVTCRWIHKPELSEELLIDPMSPYPP